MINLLTKVQVKDNSGVKSVKCVSTLKKKKVKVFNQFKSVILASSSLNSVKGQLTNSMLCLTAKNLAGRTGKTKNFANSSACITKELKKNKPVLSQRLTGLQLANMRLFIVNKSAVDLNSLK
jgi:ribosomal protein L14